MSPIAMPRAPAAPPAVGGTAVDEAEVPDLVAVHHHERDAPPVLGLAAIGDALALPPPMVT